MGKNLQTLISCKKTIIIFTIIISNIFILNASDRTDALALQNQCETESKILEIPTRNFGDEKDIIDFEDGLKKIKLGKVKNAQSKYREAMALFNEYLQMQFNIYKNLAEKYIKRTEKMNDDSAEELIEYVDDPKILRNFESAFQYITTAKKYFTTKHYSKAVGSCRLAKRSILENYKIAGIELPESYKKDLEDISNKLYQ